MPPPGNLPGRTHQKESSTMSSFNRRSARLIPATAPLTPLSVNDFKSPLDDLRTENAKLRKAQQFKTDATVLRLQLDNGNFRDFLKKNGLYEEFRTLFPY
jgi:hypothetical protein